MARKRQKQEISNLLQVFNSKHINALLLHYRESVTKFEQGDWEGCILKAGKFIEAVIKALAVHGRLALPPARKFKVGNIVQQLNNLDSGKYDDVIRVLIPRNCVFVYDIASNRGARHDPAEIDPNKMDASVVIPNLSWILAEMVRFSQKGTMHPEEAVTVTDSLMEKKYPHSEDIDGRIYINRNNMSATDVALLILDRNYPRRTNQDYLIEMLQRHTFTEKNSKTAVERIKKYIDNDGNGGLILRGSGRQKAAEIRADS